MRVALLTGTFTIFLILAAFFSVYYDYTPNGIYNQEWNEYEQQAVLETLRYLNNKEAELFFYEENEKAHLADVRRIINLLKILFAISFLILASQVTMHVRNCWKEKKCPCKPLFREVCKWGGISTLIIVLLLALFSLFNFSRFWELFHRVLFPQGNWQFPLDSTLITLFPESFFAAFTTHVILAIASFALLSLILSYWLRTTSSART